MGRKNKRKKTDYPDGLGFNAWKYIRPGASRTTRISRTTRVSRTTGASAIPAYDWQSRGKETRLPQRGDIWFAALDPHAGTSIQGGCRPVLIVSNNIGNAHAETLNVLPMTRHLKKPNLPCHTELDPDAIFDKRQMMDYSMILAEQITTIGKDQLRNYVGRIDEKVLKADIDRAVSIQLGLIPIPQHYEKGATNG